MANALLLEGQIAWPALPVHIRTLLKEKNIQTALFASVRLHNKQQVIDFQILYANGITKQGSITYPSLPAAVHAISQQLLHLILPDSNKTIKNSSEYPLAAQALVEGMQALQKEGALQAEKFFKAAITLQHDSHWARVHLAQSRYLLGDWQQAEKLFAQVPDKVLDEDQSLASYMQYWRTELSYRRGDDNLAANIERAITLSEATLDIKNMARIYRLQSQLAWQKMQWHEHRQWQEKSQRLFTGRSELSIEADKLFYLGNPSNEGLEKNPNNNLQHNQEHLLKALNFYLQLGDQSKIAASEFAIARNYSFTLKVREKALAHTVQLYKKLQQPYELAQVLIYAGFFQMQLHNGEVANTYFKQAKEIANKIGAAPLVDSTNYYLAFSLLDQGLDQREIGGHGKNENKLQQAILSFETILENTNMSNAENIKIHGSTLVFLAWANTELGLYDLALMQLQQAKIINIQYGMETTAAYSSYSMMRIYLAQKDFKAVIELADDKITTRLQAMYLARAYYEMNQVGKAVSLLADFKQQFPLLWQVKDDRRLAQYQLAVSGEVIELGKESKAHLVYCESDWTQ